MNAYLYALSQTLDSLTTRAELLRALDDLEDHYDAFNEIETELADQLIGILNQRLARLAAADGKA